MREDNDPASLLAERGRRRVRGRRLIADGVFVNRDEAAIRLQGRQVTGAQFAEVAVIGKATLGDGLGTPVIDRLDFEVENDCAASLLVEADIVVADRSLPARIARGRITGLGYNKGRRDQ